MTKIMLVEDDNNLREIYEARLLAEGYEIVAAKDGEEALATAVKEKPDLIISDVMMPKISGFDMLDILRSTPETKNTKVIMMTALSQAEDKARADKLGADKYLVKSQVTLEDVARVAQEVINGEASAGIDNAAPGPAAAAAAAAASAPAPAPAADPAPVASVIPEPAAPAPAPAPITDTPAPATPVAPIPEPSAAPASAPVALDSGLTLPTDPTTPAAPAAEPAAAAPTDELAKIQEQISSFTAAPDAEPAPAPAAPAPAPAAEVEPIGVKEAPVADEQPAAPATPVAEEGAGSSKRVIQPLNDLSQPSATDLADLAAKEEALEAKVTDVPSLPPVNPDVPVAETVIAPTAPPADSNASDSPAL